MAKPNKYPEFATGQNAQIEEPNEQKKVDGWVVGEEPPAEFFNWLFNLIGLWVRYFDQLTTELSIFVYDKLAPLMLKVKNLEEAIADLIAERGWSVGDMKFVAGAFIDGQRWMRCDGSEISSDSENTLHIRNYIDSYAPFLKKNGKYYLPNMMGATAIGYGNDVQYVNGVPAYYNNYNIGDRAGEIVHVLLEPEMPRHSHKYSHRSGDQNTDAGTVRTAADDVTVTLDSTFAGGDSPHNNMPPYYAGVWLIKVR